MQRETIEPKKKLPKEWDMIDAIIILNVISEADRLANARRELRKLNLEDCAYIIRSTKDEQSAAKGCYESHRYAAKMSLDRHWKKTLILEDNFCIREDPLPKLRRRLEALPSEADGGWYVLKIGHFPLLPWYDWKTKLWKGKSLWCTAQVISEDYAHWFPRWKDVESGVIRSLTRLGRNSIDRIQMSEIGGKTYMTIPSLVFVQEHMGRSSSFGQYLGSGYRMQRFIQFIFPIFYLLFLGYVLYRIWCFRTLAKAAFKKKKINKNAT